STQYDTVTLWCSLGGMRFFLFYFLSFMFSCSHSHTPHPPLPPFLSLLLPPFLFFFLSLPLSLSLLQMNRPIQVKPADSESRGGTVETLFLPPSHTHKPTLNPPTIPH